ncbi:MAG: lysophospholipid acyltransferase family protein [Woeseiaceae bacterium]
MPETLTSDEQKSEYREVESRRSSSSSRRLSPARRLFYFLGLPVLRAAIRVLWWSYRIETVIGADIAHRLVADGQVCAPCYWHQHHVLCTNMIRGWIRKGFKACFLVSSSVDGDVPAGIARAWGADVIRGSANQTGTLVLRDMREAIKRGVSIVTTADGPMGPKHEFKAGAALMARISSVPMIPLAAAADRAWYLNRWDDFMIPKPFARLVLGVGEPVSVPPTTPLEQIEDYRVRMQEAIMSLMDQCSDTLKGNRRH